MFFRRLVCVELIFSLLCLPLSVLADEVPAAEVNSNIVTEYNSADLKEPIVFDATETVAGVGEQLEIPAKSCILMEVKTGEILYENDSHLKLPPASITKVMALLLVMEAIDSGQLSLDTVLTASPYACSMGGSQIWLEPNEQMSVNDLLKAAVIGSANDATVMLGEALAGSEKGFVAMMNERAGQLGMTDTTFINSTGLDADGHVTSAHDIAVMSRELIKHDLIKNYSTVWMDSLRNGESELVNTNKLVRFYEGANGMKTGSTSIAKYCLSATAKRNDVQLIAVVLQAPTSKDRFGDASTMLNYGFNTYENVKVCEKGKVHSYADVKKGTQNSVGLMFENDFSSLEKKGNAQNIHYEIKNIEEFVTAPVKKGEKLGTAEIYNGEEKIGEVSLVARDSIEKVTLWYTFTKLYNTFANFII